MMTTDSTFATGGPRPHGPVALGVAVLGGLGAGAVLAVVAVLVDGSAGLLGALAGAGLALVVLATGFAVVDLVAGLMPSASLLVALLTYTLQLVLLAGVLLVLRGADDLEQSLSPGWSAGGVMAVAFAWTVLLVVHAMRARIPHYDLPGPAAPTTPSTVRSDAAEASER